MPTENHCKTCKFDSDSGCVLTGSSHCKINSFFETNDVTSLAALRENVYVDKRSCKQRHNQLTALVSGTIKIIKLSMVTAWEVAMPGTHSYADTTCTHRAVIMALSM